MRRILFAVLASAAVLVAMPASALARHDEGRRHEHHRGRHREHARDVRARHEHRNRDREFPPANAGDAGKVQSFTGGVLVIKLNGGSTVSGEVTQRTELACEAAEPAGMQRDDHGSGGGGPSGGDQGDQGGSGEGDQGDRGEDQGEDEMCAPGALAPGASVHEAELKITSSGAFWDEVELTTQS